MRAALGVALLAANAGCSTEQFVTNEASGGFSVALQSEDYFPDGRPILTLLCGEGSSSFWLGLVRTPDTPPARMLGTLKIDDAVPVAVELIWLTGDKWAPRLDEAQEAGFVRAMVRARNVYFAVPDGISDRVFRWNMTRLEDQAGRLRAGCG